MRRMLKTTNATPQKRSGEGVLISGPRAFRRIVSPPHSAVHIYVRIDIEKITKASVISRKIAFDKSIVKKRFRALLKRTPHLNGGLWNKPRLDNISADRSGR